MSDTDLLTWIEQNGIHKKKIPARMTGKIINYVNEKTYNIYFTYTCSTIPRSAGQFA